MSTTTGAVDVDQHQRKSALRRHLGAAAARCGIRVHDLYLGETDLRKSLPATEPRVEVEVTAATGDDLERIDVLLDEEARLAFRRNCASGGRCLVGRVDGAIAGSIWEHLRIIHLVGLHLGRLPDQVGYTFGGYVLPRYRRAGVFQCLIRAAAADLRVQGCHTMWNLVNRSNVAAVAARQRLGTEFRRVLVLELPGVHPIILGARITAADRS